jgi:hypothetical protein
MFIRGIAIGNVHVQFYKSDSFGIWPIVNNNEIDLGEKIWNNPDNINPHFLVGFSIDLLFDHFHFYFQTTAWDLRVTPLARVLFSHNFFIVL